VHLVGFIKRIYHDARSSERQIRNPSVIQRIDEEGFIWHFSCLLLSNIQELPLMYAGNNARSCHLYTDSDSDLVHPKQKPDPNCEYLRHQVLLAGT